MYFLAYFLYYFVTAGRLFACLYQAGELQDPQTIATEETSLSFVGKYFDL